MSDSRYIRYNRRRLPSQKRTIPIWGADTELIKQSGKLFRCWNCGFPCNTDRDQLGDGVGYSIYDEVEVEYRLQQTGDQKDVTVTCDLEVNLPQLDMAGDNFTVTHNHTTIMSSGCKFCGCRNYK